jgi:hypothetical protein
VGVFKELVAEGFVTPDGQPGAPAAGHDAPV